MEEVKEINDPVSGAVKNVRSELGLSQEKLAKIAGISKTTLIKAEKGGNTGTEVLMKIADATGKSLKIQFEEK